MSALIHAATMVTAGVYLVARCTPLFVHAPTAQLVVSGIGAVTALIAALIALTQNDLKRVLAYSTVSQLGYMFMALGAGAAGPEAATLATTAGMFHLFTHAFFKALLFLAAGSVMHAMGDVIDMRRFGGLRRALPITHWTFLCGAAALAGVPLLSGFWSKDEILAVLARRVAAFDAWRATSTRSLWSAAFTALLTAFYTFRAYFMTFWGEERFPEEAGHHPHEAPPVMAWPLRMLAVCAVFIGLAVGPTHWFAELSASHVGLGEVRRRTASHVGADGRSARVIALVGIGAGVADCTCARRSLPGASCGGARAALQRVAQQVLFRRDLTGRCWSRRCAALAWLSNWFDRAMIDPLVDIVGMVPRLREQRAAGVSQRAGAVVRAGDVDRADCCACCLRCECILP